MCDDSPSIIDKHYTWIIYRKGHAFEVGRSQPNLNTTEALVRTFSRKKLG